MAWKNSFKFSSNIKHFFFKNENLWKDPLDKRNSVFCTLPVFSVRIQESFWRQARNIYEKIHFKTDSFPQIFPRTGRKQISKRWHFLVRKLKVCPSKSEDDYQSVSKKHFHLRKLSSGRTSSLQSWLPCRKHLPKSETVLFNQLRNIQTFFRFFCSSNDPLDT